MLGARPTFVVTLPEPEPLCALSAMGPHLFVQSAAGAAWCLAPAHGEVFWRLSAPGGGRIAPLPGGDLAVRFDANGEVAVVESSSGRARPAAPLPGHLAGIERVTVSPDGRWIFVQVGFLIEDFHLIYGDYNRREEGAFLWEVDREAVAWDEQTSRFGAVSPRFSHDGQYLLMPPGLDRPMAWVEARSGTTRHAFTSVRWFHAMVISAEGHFAVHQLLKPGALARTAMDPEPRPTPALVFATGRKLTPLALTPDDAAVVAVARRRLAAFELLRGLPLGKDVALPVGFRPSCSAFAPDGRALFVGSDDGRVACYDVDPTAPGLRALAPAIAATTPANGLEPALGRGPTHHWARKRTLDGHSTLDGKAGSS